MKNESARPTLWEILQAFELCAANHGATEEEITQAIQDTLEPSYKLIGAI